MNQALEIIIEFGDKGPWLLTVKTLDKMTGMTETHKSSTSKNLKPHKGYDPPAALNHAAGRLQDCNEEDRNDEGRSTVIQMKHGQLGDSFDRRTVLESRLVRRNILLYDIQHMDYKYNLSQ
jgi:hypothetical protein